MIDQVLDTALANRTIAIICFIGFTALGWILRMIFDVSLALYQDWRDQRRERKAAPEVEAWQKYLSTDTDPNLTTEKYYAAHDRRTLSGDWRELVEDPAPQPPEIVAGNIYLENTYQFNSPIRAEVEGQRTWPQWTEADRNTPGRHRAPDSDDSMSWRKEYTGEWEKVNTNRKELVNA